VDAKPGLEMLIFGQYFNRNDTWAEDAGPWIGYLARTSYLLQQGRYVADVAYFYGEDHNLTELFDHRFNTDVPTGYRYDYINPEALMTRLSVRDGRLVTPSGMSYRVLFLPPHVTRLTLPALRKLSDLARAGAIIVGPSRSAASDCKVQMPWSARLPTKSGVQALDRRPDMPMARARSIRRRSGAVLTVRRIRPTSRSGV